MFKKFLSILIIGFLYASSVYAQISNYDEMTVQLDELEKSITSFEKIVTESHTENELVEIKTHILDLQVLVDELGTLIEEPLSSINDQLAVLGEKPDDAIAENPDVTAKRSHLVSNRQTLLAIQLDMQNSNERILDLLNIVARQRQILFSDRIFQRSVLSGQLFMDAPEGIAALASRFNNTFRAWWIITLKPLAVVLSVFCGVVLAIGILGLYFLRRFKKFTPPDDYFEKLAQVFFYVIGQAIIIGLVALSIWGIGVYYKIFSPKISEILQPMVWAVLGIAFIVILLWQSLSPLNVHRRILPVTDKAARKIFIWLVLLTTIYAADFSFSAVSTAFNARLSVAMINSICAAILIAIVLGRLAFVRMDDRQSEFALPLLVRAPILMIVVTILCTVVFGYIGLSRFIAQQVVVTGAIASLTMIGLIAGREIAGLDVFASTRLGQACKINLDLTDNTLNQIGLAVGSALVLLSLLIGIPGAMLQWGVHIEDITNWAQSAFYGFNVGSIRISVAGIAMGIAIFILGIWITRSFQRWVIDSFLSRTSADFGVSNSIKTAVGYSGYALAFLVALTSVGVNLSSLAIVAGALSLGIGFGLQAIVGNFVSGLIILAERPIKVGDLVSVGGSTGTVKKISVRATELQTANNQSIIMPNSEFINAPVGNWTHKMTSGRLDIPVGVAYGSDIVLVKEILLSIADAHPAVMMSPEPFVFFAGLGDSSLDFQIRVHLYRYLEFPKVQTELLFAIIAAFEEHGIEIPFPQRDLNIRSDFRSDTQ